MRKEEDVRQDSPSIQRLSVIVPRNPFAPPDLQGKKHCLCALDVEKLMLWWPGMPHSPHRDANKVRAIQRSLDWKRVAQIASYLLQEEIIDVPDKLDKYFRSIYEPKKMERGREWPPRVKKIIGFQRSEFPTFSNVLLHVNGAEIKEIETHDEQSVAKLIFDENSTTLNFSVIDGQHRINGAFLAIKIRQENVRYVKWAIPAEVFLDLDPASGPPRKQAQIFIDVNFYQKKVDRSLVADLFPTARGRDPLDQKERAQDIGRRLMLEKGPLVGMIQIPGIRYGVKDVVTLATLNSAIERELPMLDSNGIDNLEMQTDFIAQCLSAWLEASGRFEEITTKKHKELDPQNVAYQGRILISIIALTPALIWKLKKKKAVLVSENALSILTKWLKEIAYRAGMLDNDVFLDKTKFKKRGYLGSGGIGRFRDALWASILRKRRLVSKKPEEISKLANSSKKIIKADLNS